MLAHGFVESSLARMAKWRMSDVVNQGEGLSKVDIEPKLSRYRARDLCYFDGVGESISEMIANASGKDLSLVFESSKGARVDDAVTVTLVVVAIGV